MRVVNAENYIERRDAISHDWPKFLKSINCIPVFIPNSSSTESFLEEMSLDGIILSGGDNIGDHKDRDQTEKIILNYAISKNIPIFGVCRGMQILNQYFGGSLTTSSSKTHVGQEHSINIVNENYSKIISSEITVNSFHDNIITSKNIGANLKPFAESKTDQTIEGFFHETYLIIGVMWHPEREQKLFDELIIKNLLKKHE